MRIRWTTDAADDLERIAVYLLRENPSAARRAIQNHNRWHHDTDSISESRPARTLAGYAGALVPIVAHIVVYFVKVQAIEILRVYHAAQDWP